MTTLRTYASLLMTVGLLMLLGSCNTDSQLLDPNPCEFTTELDGYTLVWADEFEGSEVDESSWTFELGDGCERNLCGWGNNELQYYTSRPENVRVENGNLVIEARAEASPFEGYDYTSTRMVTKGKRDFLFGRIDIRARLPIGQGLWPAIWMLPTENKFGIWPKSGEIDIMELVGNKPSEVFSTVHYGHDFWRFTSLDKYLLETGTFADEFHTFTVLWRENCIRFMVDGTLIEGAITPSTTLPTTYPFNETFHMILNVAVGGNLPGSPDETTAFPQEMVVDYVRVYEEN